MDDFYHVVELLPTMNVKHFNPLENAGTMLVIHRCHMFESAKDVGAYMWGRSLGTSLIYKNGKLVVESYQYQEVSKLIEFLEGYV